MKEFVPVLKRTKLFSGVGDDDISTMLSCLGARLLPYKKGEYVLRQGEHLSDILVLAEGRLHIQRDLTCRQRLALPKMRLLLERRRFT